MKAPCKGCTERIAVPNCHTTCKRYLDWKAEYDKQKSKVISTFIESCKSKSKC